MLVAFGKQCQYLNFYENQYVVDLVVIIFSLNIV